MVRSGHHRASTATWHSQHQPLAMAWANLPAMKRMRRAYALQKSPVPALLAAVMPVAAAPQRVAVDRVLKACCSVQAAG